MMGSVVLKRLLPVAVVLTMLVPAAQAAGFERLEQYGVGAPSGSSGGLVTSYGVAVSSQGAVVASDITTVRVNVFSQSGQFLRAFGRDVSTAGGEGVEICTNDCKIGSTGSGAGELNLPWGVAVGESEIYVGEYANNRVSAFDYEGHFLRAFGANVGGAGVNVCTSTCAAGTAVASAGSVVTPAGIALDAAGNLLVSDIGTARVDIFNPRTGQFLGAFGKNVGGAGVNSCTNPCVIGTPDATPGSLSTSYGISIGPNGEIFISELGGVRVSVFNGQGQFLRSFGSPGEGAGQLGTPWGTAASPDGAVYIPELASHRVSVFGAGGEFRRAFGLDVIPGGLLAAEVCTAVCKSGLAGQGIGEFMSPGAVATDCRGALYVAQIGRIEKWGEPGNRLPPCPSNAMSIGAKKTNKKKGTLAVEVTVAGPGTLTGGAGPKISAAIPQPVAAGTLTVTLKAAGKGVKTLRKKGKLKGTLSLTFTPPNGDPNTQTAKVVLKKKLKKHKKGQKRRGKGGGR